MEQDHRLELLYGIGVAGVIAGNLIADAATGRDLDAVKAGTQAFHFLTEEVAQVNACCHVAVILHNGHFIAHIHNSPYFLDLLTRMEGCSKMLMRPFSQSGNVSSLFAFSSFTVAERV